MRSGRSNCSFLPTNSEQRRLRIIMACGPRGRVHCARALRRVVHRAGSLAIDDRDEDDELQRAAGFVFL